MPKSKNQKQKILYIMKFFYEETDEEHTLTVNEIIAKLERNGISAARRSIYDDIRTLQAFGVDIVMRKSKTSTIFTICYQKEKRITDQKAEKSCKQTAGERVFRSDLHLWSNQEYEWEYLL